jgi:AraC-like DNA-binding protein
MVPYEFDKELSDKIQEGGLFFLIGRDFPEDRSIRFRCHIACRLLFSTNLPIKEISTRSRFPNQRIFNKVFLSYLGISPKRFRKYWKEKKSAGVFPG